MNTSSLRSCLARLPSSSPKRFSSPSSSIHRHLSSASSPSSSSSPLPASSFRLSAASSLCRRPTTSPTFSQRSASTNPPPSSSASSIPPQQNPWAMRPGQDSGDHVKQMRDLQAELNKKMYKSRQSHISTIGMYATAAMIVMLGASYAAVPVYRAFCGATGFAGIPMTERSRMAPDRLVPTSSERRITVRFNASKSDILPWTFKPAQQEVTVRPGETALAFYTAKNESDQDIIGISTYNVTPGKIAPYFAKVECFCFEEQKILANEEVDLPVFFFIDRDVLEDPKMDDVEDVVLNYTFFKARRNQKGHSVPDAPQAVVDEASGWADIEMADTGKEKGWVQVGAK